MEKVSQKKNREGRKNRAQGGEQQELSAVDPEGIFAVFPCPVRQYVHKLQSFQSKEA